VPNSITDTNPVWSSTDDEAGPCLACGGDYATLTASERIQITHCGGTGAICIDKLNGHSCSTGTAPGIGDFPGGVKDFLLWGAGAYALSINGDQVYTYNATVPVFETGPGLVAPWTNIYAIGPNRIAISGQDGKGQYKVARAWVNDIGEVTCCS
jgi:hypothetical protein